MGLRQGQFSGFLVCSSSDPAWRVSGPVAQAGWGTLRFTSMSTSRGGNQLNSRIGLGRPAHSGGVATTLRNIGARDCNGCKRRAMGFRHKPRQGRARPFAQSSFPAAVGHQHSTSPTAAAAAEQQQQNDGGRNDKQREEEGVHGEHLTDKLSRGERIILRNFECFAGGASERPGMAN